MAQLPDVPCGNELELLNSSISKEVFYDDVYGMLQHPINHFKTIIDIGANAGVFCIQARVLNPKARIIAFEPYFSPYKHLKQNMKRFRVEIYHVGIGDGKIKWLKQTNNTTLATVFDKPKSGCVPIVTMSLQQIFDEIVGSDPGRIMLKSDCEGGERFLRGHEGLLRKCHQVSMELHWEKRVASGYPKEDWQQWVNQFKDEFRTHENWGSRYGIVVMNKRQ